MGKFDSVYKPMFSRVTSIGVEDNPLHFSKRGSGVTNSLIPASLSPSQERKQLAEPPIDPLYSTAICLRLLIPLEPFARTENQ